jgi:Ricin-type beta-trefoil lectin domain-like
VKQTPRRDPAPPGGSDGAVQQRRGRQRWPQKKTGNAVAGISEKGKDMRFQLRTKVAVAAFAVIGAGLVAGAVPANAASGVPIYNYSSNLCLGVAGSGNAGQYNCNSSEYNQQWRLVYVGSGQYEIINGNGACLYVEGLAQANGAQLKASTSECNQTWYIGEWTYPGAGEAQTLSAYYTNSPWVAGISGGSLNSGAQAVLWQHQSPPHENQYWYSSLW